jgi:hypothetical protein
MSAGRAASPGVAGAGAGKTEGAVSADEIRTLAKSLGGGPVGVGGGATRADAAVRDGGVVGAQRLHGPQGAAGERAGGRVRLGEELPIFCERCGYALHGLPQQRCDRCAILQFACPECGHRQPINTLRPAAQRVLGRLRAFALGLWVLFKLNFFGWLLFAWFGMGVEWSYRFNSFRDPANPNNWRYQMIPRPVDVEAAVAFAIFSLAFGMFGRMLLLRWRRGWAVGGVLAVLVLLAAYLGAWFRANVDFRNRGIVMPLGLDFQMLLIGAALMIIFAAVVVWPIWLALTHLFLPDRTAKALLEWQRSIPAGAPTLARQE